MSPKDLAAMETPTPISNNDPNGNAEAEWAEWVTPGKRENAELLSFDDTDKERRHKKRYTDRVNQRAPPEPYIDDADTNPELLSFDDTEKERDKKLNYVKKVLVARSW